MVAGATGIDLFLLVVDAGEGARPQTLEHLAILRLLGVEHGVVAVTKADAVDEETLELGGRGGARAAPGRRGRRRVGARRAPGSTSCARRSRGCRRSSARPTTARRGCTSTASSASPGIGTVVTGTLWSGTIAAGDVLRVVPAGCEVRVRSVQVHDEPVERAEAGSASRSTSPDVERRELTRGDALVEPGHYPVSYRLDVVLEELAEVPARGDRLPRHLGVAGTRRARSGRYAQLRLARAARRGARRPGRACAPETTVGGGRVLDPAPPRGLDEARLAVLERGDPSARPRARRRARSPSPSCRRAACSRRPSWRRDSARSSGRRARLLASAGSTTLKDRVRDALAERARAEPARPGRAAGRAARPSRGSPHVAEPARDRAPRREGVPARARPPRLGERAEAAAALEARLAAEEIVKLDDRALAAFLEREGRLRRVGDGFAVSAELYDRGRGAPAGRCGEITLAGFRDALGVGRRTAQLLLERFDADGITLRLGDRRLLRRARD